MNNIKHEYTSDIVCPWCGYSFQDDECSYIDYEHKIECLECGNNFYVESHITIDYSTTKEKCGGKCAYELKKRYKNPYIYKDKNWCIWECSVCNHTVAKTGEIKESPYVIPLEEKD